MSTLKDIYNFQYGIGNNNPDNNGKYPIYGSNGIIGGYDQYNSEDSPVIGHIGANCGVVVFAKGKHFVTYNGVICKIKPDNDFKYGYYALLNSNLRERVRGSAQPFISYDLLDSVPVYLPDSVTQRKIGDCLWKLDQKIENNNNIIIELESMAKTIYDYWFLQFDFPDENGKPYKSSGGKMVWNEELKREIPKGWEVGTLYNIADYINGLACQKYRPKDNEGYLPVVKIAEMHNGINGDTECVSINIPEKNKISAGDILFSWSATLEVMLWCGVDAGLNQHIFKVNPKSGYSREYVFEQLSSYVINFVKMAESRKTTMGHITSEHMEQSRIVLPLLDIVDKFTNIAKPLFDKIVLCNKENQELASLRDFLLPMLMNGQVTFKE